MIHLLRFWGSIATFFHSSIGFCMRLTCALADVGSLLVLWRIGQEVPALNIRPLMLLMVAASPVSLFISGFHGNTDPIMIFLVLLSIYFIEARKSPLLGGIFMSLAMSIKIVPVIFVPAAFFYFSEWKSRIQFVLLIVSVFLVASLPQILL